MALPQAPIIKKEVPVTNASDFNLAASQAGNRILVKTGIAENVEIRGSDIDVVLSQGASLAKIQIYSGSRIRITGGTIQWIGLWASSTPITDVTIDNVTITSDGTGLNESAALCGSRVALLNSRVINDVLLGCPDYSGHDLVMANTVLKEPAHDGSVNSKRILYISAADKVAVVDSYIEMAYGGNPLIVDGMGGKIFFGRNTLVDDSKNGSTISLAANQGDQIGEMWITGNSLYANSLAGTGILGSSSRVASLHATSNTRYSGDGTGLKAFVLTTEGVPIPTSWNISGNQDKPAATPPAR